jgi:hypothetical protein
MRGLVAVAILLASPVAASAQTFGSFGDDAYGHGSLGRSRSTFGNTTTTYDWRTGSSYSTTYNSDGSSRTRGFNGQTGSMWSSETDRRGNSRGIDAQGNMWSYNPQNGSYMSTDGTVCIGKGALRTCN